MTRTLFIGGCLTLLVVSAVYAQEFTPLTEDHVSTLVSLKLDDKAIVKRIQQGGIEFEPTKEVLERLKGEGATLQVLDSLKKAKITSPTRLPKPFEKVSCDLRLLTDDFTIVSIRSYPPGKYRSPYTEELEERPVIVWTLQAKRQIPNNHPLIRWEYYAHFYKTVEKVDVEILKSRLFCKDEALAPKAGIEVYAGDLTDTYMQRLLEGPATKMVIRRK